MKLIQNTFLILYQNKSFFQLTRKNLSNSFHIIEDLYHVFYIYDIFLVLVIGLVEIYQAGHQMSQSNLIFYLLL